MSSDDAAISARGLGKRYRIGAAHVESTLAEQLKQRVRNPRSARTTTYDALTDVSFDITPGQVVGVIGRNGAGKSTLLKVLSRITPPTSGEAVIRGRVGSLLEVGTGFHPELTGRENIWLNGAVLGMRRAEVAARFDDIVDFAGVATFLDTPVKRYSSGMYVRLAFALAVHLSVDVLLVDEVLAVGDQEFQQRSLAKMRSVATDGRTVVLVSHQLNTVASLCDATMYLRQGRLASFGPTTDVLAHYRSDTRQEGSGSSLGDPATRPGTGEVHFTALNQDDGDDDVLRLRWAVRCRSERETFYLSFHVVNAQGLTVLQCDSRLVHALLTLRRGQELAGDFRLVGPGLVPGQYRVDAFVCRTTGLLDVVEDALAFSASPFLPYPHATSPDALENGLVLSDFQYRVSSPAQPA